MTLPEDLKQLLLAFNAHGVEYLIISGYAVGVYSEPRATKDHDLFIRSNIPNSEAVYRALSAFARALNLSAGYISQLERGTKQPKGPALALLNVIRRKGLEAIL
ncbi:MAG: hypothetical protein ABR907_15165 [Terracidiphilus sp.]|jgi:transcriptional regulator with XRE-family HTH domain